METSKPDRSIDRGLTHLRLKNFRSIAATDIALTPLTIFVGPNASGKSNVLRSLSFLRNALTLQLGTALDLEGGLNSVRRQTVHWRALRHGPVAAAARELPPNMGISVRFLATADDSVPREVEYGFELSSTISPVRYKVARERCVVRLHSHTQHAVQFDRKLNRVESQPEIPLPRLSAERLLLPLLTGIEEYAQVYDALAGIQTYSISPSTVRESQKPDAGLRLEGDGRNLASVIKEIRAHDDAQFARMLELLGTAIPGQPEVYENRHGDRLGLTFLQRVGEARLTFDAFEMSDGTLRLLAILAAVYQRPSPLAIGVEEPEATIHPGAMGVLLDMFKSNYDQTQILITTHSPDILEDKELLPDFIRLVDWNNGVTTISPVGQAARESIQERLMLAGELLRSNALRPDDQPPTPETSVELFPEW